MRIESSSSLPPTAISSGASEEAIGKHRVRPPLIRRAERMEKRAEAEACRWDGDWCDWRDPLRYDEYLYRRNRVNEVVLPGFPTAESSAADPGAEADPARDSCGGVRRSTSDGGAEAGRPSYAMPRIGDVTSGGGVERTARVEDSVRMERFYPNGTVIDVFA